MILKPETYDKIVENLVVTFDKLAKKPERMRDLVMGLGKILSFNELDRFTTEGRKFDFLLYSMSSIYCYLQDSFGVFNEYIKAIRKKGNTKERFIAKQCEYIKIPTMDLDLVDRVLIYSSKNNGIIKSLNQDKRDKFLKEEMVDENISKQVIGHYVNLSYEIVYNLINSINIQSPNNIIRNSICDGINEYAKDMTDKSLLRPFYIFRIRRAQGKALSSFFNVLMCGVPEKCVFTSGCIKLVPVLTS